MFEKREVIKIKNERIRWEKETLPKWLGNNSERKDLFQTSSTYPGLIV